MSGSLQKKVKPVDQETLGWVFLLLVVLGVAWGIYGTSALRRGGDANMVAFAVLGGCFCLLAIGYLALHGLKGMSWFSVPVVVTFYILAIDIIIPGWRFFSGNDQLDTFHVHAAFLLVIGMTAFWAGSLSLMKEGRLRFAPRNPKTPTRVVLMCTIAMALGVTGKVVMWKLGLFSYLAKESTMLESLWYVQWLTSLSSLLNIALIVSAIEVLGKRTAGPFMKTIFGVAVVFSLGFGLISGLKGELLFPLIYLLVVYGITNQKFPKVALLFPVLPILLYPFGDAYRANLNHGYRDRTNTLDGLVEVLAKSFNDVVFSNRVIADEGLTKTESRMSGLTFIRDMLTVPDPVFLKGDEKVWLAPVYPFIPRAIWPSKPIFNKPQRLSIALGRPETMASAVPLIGDLYLLYGTLGVLAGLYIYGICYQLYMNWSTKNPMSEKRIFLYILMLIPLMALGGDIVAAIGQWIQQFLMFLFIAYCIYGSSFPSERPEVVSGLNTSLSPQPAT